MKGIRLRFIFWAVGWIALFLLANIRLRVFPHILLIFWMLLPILSLGFSLTMRRRFHRKESLEPLRLIHGERGTWIMALDNQSHLMPFFLHYPIPSKKSHQQQTEVMVAPRSERIIRIPFDTPYIGVYTFAAGEPYVEDLLGFFRLTLPAHTNQTLKCLALPARVEGFKPFSGSLGKADDQVVDHVSLTQQSDEIFSIDPMRDGEGFSHVHWKLSARMQKWMVRHYSDVDQEPFRMIAVPRSVKFSGRARFSGLRSQENPMVDERMRERTHFLDLFFSAVLDLLDLGYPVDIGDREGELHHLSPIASDDDRLGVLLAQLPYQSANESLRLSQTEGNPQLIWVEQLNESIFGSLLNYQRLGFEFRLITVRSQIQTDLIQKLEQSAIESIWLDEETSWTENNSAI